MNVRLVLVPEAKAQSQVLAGLPVVGKEWAVIDLRNLRDRIPGRERELARVVLRRRIAECLAAILLERRDKKVAIQVARIAAWRRKARKRERPAVVILRLVRDIYATDTHPEFDRVCAGLAPIEVVVVFVTSQRLVFVKFVPTCEPPPLNALLTLTADARRRAGRRAVR